MAPVMSHTTLAHARVATMMPDGVPYGLIDDGAVTFGDGVIQWVGPTADLPDRFRSGIVEDLEGRLVTPALIDCHTHIVAGGSRAAEFEMRLQGASYADIARAGGGILSTVEATRAASDEALLAAALPRVDQLIGEGVATVEIKSGYGLDIETELKMLRVARAIGRHRAVRVRTSFLGAHAIPRDYAGRADAYIDTVCLPALDRAHEAGLADAVDGFCEGIAFSTDQMERVFRHAIRLGLPVKLHAGQLSDLGGVALAARYGALSADHLEYVGEADVAAMAAAGSIAVLLPGAFYTLRESHAPPIALFRRHGVGMAVATDCNPGSSPTSSLLLCLNMACTLFRMTPEEALAGATREAAKALGLNDRVGVIGPGMRAELAVWDVPHPAELCYRIAFNPLYRRIVGELS